MSGVLPIERGYNHGRRGHVKMRTTTSRKFKAVGYRLSLATVIGLGALSAVSYAQDKAATGADWSAGLKAAAAVATLF